jgi:hypothetical protein
MRYIAWVGGVEQYGFFSLFFYFLLKNLEDIGLASYLCITFESDSKWAEIFQNKKRNIFWR